jgi:hypothetical protein
VLKAALQRSPKPLTLEEDAAVAAAAEASEQSRATAH